MTKINWSGNIIGQPIVPYGSNDIDITFLEDFAKIRVIDNEIREINREKDNYTLFAKSPKTVSQIKKEIELTLKNTIASLEASLVQIVEWLQTGVTGNMTEEGRAVTTSTVVDILEKLVSYKKLLKEVHLVPDKTSVEGISEELRESKVKECNSKMQELEMQKGEFFPRGQHQWYQEILRKVDKWEAIAKQFGKPVNPNGFILEDERWLKVYYKLGFDVMPKHKLRKPVSIDGIDYEFHPGFSRNK